MDTFQKWAARPEWKFADAFKPAQAANLWLGADPNWNRYELPGEVHKSILAVEHALNSAVQLGTVRTRLSEFERTLSTIAREALIEREHLIEFARKRNERPAFLFDTLIEVGLEPKAGVAEKLPSSGPELLKTKKHGNTAYDWNAMIVEMFKVALTPDGFDNHQSIGAMVRHLQAWFGAQEQDPEHREIEKRVSIIYKGLGLGGK